MGDSDSFRELWHHRRRSMAADDPSQGRLPPGDVLAGKYRIERLIGRGGMAEVYAAHHELLSQTVAVKVLLPEVARVPSAASRFINEARVAARIRGEHVTSVFDAGVAEDGSAYMVLEYLDGQDLEAYAEARGTLPVTEAVDYVLQALDGLAQAHALDVVHRDIKPSNLFLARRVDGSTIVKVLDFGISKALRADERSSATASQTLLGSPMYMSPEQARSAKGVDARTDIWATGVMLYRVLAGVPPFVGESLTSLLLDIVEREPTPLPELRADVSVALAAVITRCLRKDREERFANVAQLALALERFGGGESVGAVDRICRTLRVSRAETVALVSERLGVDPIVINRSGGRESVAPEDPTVPASALPADITGPRAITRTSTPAPPLVPTATGAGGAVVPAVSAAALPWSATNASASWTASQAGVMAPRRVGNRWMWGAGIVAVVLVAGAGTVLFASRPALVSSPSGGSASPVVPTPTASAPYVEIAPLPNAEPSVAVASPVASVAPSVSSTSRVPDRAGVNAPPKEASVGRPTTPARGVTALPAAGPPSRAPKAATSSATVRPSTYDILNQRN